MTGTTTQFNSTTFAFGSPAAATGLASALIPILPNAVSFPGTTSYTPVAGDHLRGIGSASAGGALTIHLPNTLNNGFILFALPGGGNNIVLTGTPGTVNILFNGQSVNSVTLTTQDQAVMLVFDGANWWMIGSGSGGLVGTTGWLTTSQTITVPPGATRGRVFFGGATGGSGGFDGGGNSAGSTGGTGSGGYLEYQMNGLVPGQTVIYTASPAGAAGALGGGNGGNASAATLASGTATIPTLTVSGSNGSIGVPSGGVNSAGSAAGTATGGDLNLTGTPGTAPVSTSGSPGTGGICGVSIGVTGVGGTKTQNLTGNPGNPSLLKIDWYG